MFAGSGWRKSGLIYSLDQRLAWATSHVQIPTVLDRKDGRLQIFFSSRDQQNRSLVGSMFVDAADPKKILNVIADPILELGCPGSFDDCGVMPSSVVQINGTVFLYYIGWNVRNTVPYHNSVGLAISEDGGDTFRKAFEGPVMDRTPLEPYFCATTCIRVENGLWRNWYLSCTDWRSIQGRMEPLYHLKYAESPDGVHWQRDGVVAIDYVDDNEGGIVRASVVKQADRYSMWFCFRGHTNYREATDQSYRIGYAESTDGVRWFRRDDGPIVKPSVSGWDSDMVAYPEVIETESGTYMFYNGNGFGKTGFGYAKWI